MNLDYPPHYKLSISTLEDNQKSWKASFTETKKKVKVSAKFGLKHQKSLPHEVDWRRDENEAGNEARMVLAHLEADPTSHAAADQDEATVGILLLGNLEKIIKLISFCSDDQR